MLSETQTKNLETHILGMFQSVVVPEITPSGYILAADPDGRTIPDNVTTHHLVELCIEISPNLTKEIIDRACSWFLQTGETIRNRFLITTLASAGKLSKEDQIRILNDALFVNQKPSGFIDLYSGFLDGGSAFSTLWAIRIAALLNCDANTLMDNAFGALDSHWDDLHRSSFKGFYYEICNTLSKSDGRSEDALRDILAAQDQSGRWDDVDFYTAYIIGNLLSGQDPIHEDCIAASSRGLIRLFALDEAPAGPPPVFKSARQSYADSTFIQLCLRSLLSAVRYLKKVSDRDMKEPLAASLFGFLPTVYHSHRVTSSELKLMNQQYGEIKSNFDHLEKKISESILRESPYDRNVFIMMPFRHNKDERHERIVASIKAVLESNGFTGWMASDGNLAPQLWENVASYMLACKYGIAVFTRVENEREIRVKDFNPNVSLELGFFLSRGKTVLLLKDKILPSLQADLVGHLYEPFDLNKNR